MTKSVIEREEMTKDVIKFLGEKGLDSNLSVWVILSYMDTKLNFTRKQLRTGFRGWLYSGKDFVGSIYLIDGRGLVLDVEDGEVRRIIEEHKPSEFIKAGIFQASASQVVQKWNIKN